MSLPDMLEWIVPCLRTLWGSNFSSLSDMQEDRSIDNQILYHIQLHHNHHHYYHISHLQNSDIHVHSCHQNTPALKHKHTKSYVYECYKLNCLLLVQVKTTLSILKYNFIKMTEIFMVLFTQIWSAYRHFWACWMQTSHSLLCLKNDLEDLTAEMSNRRQF